MARIGAATRIGPYVVVKPLEDGQGGMAQLFVARLSSAGDEEGTLVALKVTKAVDQGSDEEREHRQEVYFDALNNEVELLRKLRHPNVVRLFPIQAELRGTPYIARANEIPARPWYCVMEYLAGGSLANAIDSAPGKRLPLAVAVEIAYQIALALEYIHLKGIAHLDIKPDNILFRQPLASGDRPELALIDFGIARREKQTGLPAGAASYMSPERIQLVREELDRRSVTDQRPADVYALGVVLYRSIAGSLPFSRRDKSTTTQVILKEEPVPLSRHVKEVPPPVEDIIARCLQKDPTKRATIPEVLAALDEAVSPPRWAVLSSKSQEGKLPSPPLPSGRPRALVGIIGLLLGLILGCLMASLIFVMVVNPTLGNTNPISGANSPTPAQILKTPIPTVTGIQTISSPSSPTVTPLPTFTVAPMQPASATPAITAAFVPTRSATLVTNSMTRVIVPGAIGKSIQVWLTPPSSPTSYFLFADDFVDNRNGWDTSRAYIETNAYRVKQTDDRYSYWPSCQKCGPFADFAYAATLTKIDGPDIYGYGLTFRGTNQSSSFYAFMISNGTWELSRLASDGWHTIQNWTPHSAINKGNGKNKLRVVCRGPKFEFYANDQLIGTANDGSYTSGDIGVGVAGSGIDIRVESIRVSSVQ